MPNPVCKLYTIPMEFNFHLLRLLQQTMYKLYNVHADQDYAVPYRVKKNHQLAEHYPYSIYTTAVHHRQKWH